jgi:hypothetical protein
MFYVVSSIKGFTHSPNQLFVWGILGGRPCEYTVVDIAYMFDTWVIPVLYWILVWFFWFFRLGANLLAFSRLKFCCFLIECHLGGPIFSRIFFPCLCRTYLFLVYSTPSCILWGIHIDLVLGSFVCISIYDQEFFNHVLVSFGFLFMKMIVE